MATITRVIAADPTSTALLLAAHTGVLPWRTPARYSLRFDLAGRPALLTLSYAGTATHASLTLPSRTAPSGVAFLDSLADEAEARADAA